MIFCEFLRCILADETCGLSVVNAESYSLDFWDNYLETVLFLKHTVKQCLVSIISQIQK